MKKFIMLFLAVFIFSAVAYAEIKEIVNNDYVIEAQNRIDKIGYNILNSNSIDKRVVFKFNIKRVKNAWTHYSDRQIDIYREIYNRLESDDEIAAVLSHEIGHAVDSYDGVFKGFFYSLSSAFAPKKYEYKADKRAVDYMVNAGYNPVSYIVVLNKFWGQRRYDWCSTRPLTSKRMMNVYEYIYKKYPAYLANNTYKSNMYYQNFLLTSQDNRSKLRKKVESGSKRPVNYQ